MVDISPKQPPIEKILFIQDDNVKYSGVQIENIRIRNNNNLVNNDYIDVHVSDEVKLESIKSFQSTISKSENGLTQMTQKGASTTLIKKRLSALYIGIAMLENAWYQKPHHVNQEDIADARVTLAGLFPSIENAYAKSRSGSPQRTLLERRIKALELAVQAIDDLSKNN